MAARLDARPGPADEGAAVQRAKRRPNRTGLPDRLKDGIEALSGLSMDDVRVHRNSDKPAQLQAYAYAQGTEIHLGPGQERHLPHEAWHVVQQKQGRVRTTRQMKGLQINDQRSLENEADATGLAALHFKDTASQSQPLIASRDPAHVTTHGRHDSSKTGMAKCGSPVVQGYFIFRNDYMVDESDVKILIKKIKSENEGTTTLSEEDIRTLCDMAESPDAHGSADDEPGLHEIIAAYLRSIRGSPKMDDRYPVESSSRSQSAGSAPTRSGEPEDATGSDGAVAIASDPVSQESNATYGPLIVGLIPSAIVAAYGLRTWYARYREQAEAAAGNSSGPYESHRVKSLTSIISLYDDIYKKTDSVITEAQNLKDKYDNLTWTVAKAMSTLLPEPVPREFASVGENLETLTNVIGFLISTQKDLIDLQDTLVPQAAESEAMRPSKESIAKGIMEKKNQVLLGIGSGLAGGNVKAKGVEKVVNSITQSAIASSNWLSLQTPIDAFFSLNQVTINSKMAKIKLPDQQREVMRKIEYKIYLHHKNVIRNKLHSITTKTNGRFGLAAVALGAATYGAYRIFSKDDNKK